MCRPRSAPTRPRLCRDAGSSVGASSTGCWEGQCAGAAGTCAGASGRSSGAAAGRGAVRVRAGRGRRAAGRGSWGYAPRGATRRCGLAPPRTQPPGTGYPGVVAGSGLSTHGEWRPRGGRGNRRRAGGGVRRAPGECGGGTTRIGAPCACAADDNGDRVALVRQGMRSVARVQPCCESRRRGAGGRGPADTGGENATWRPGEVEVATRGIATCGASVSARPEGGGSTRVRRPSHTAKGHAVGRAGLKHDRPRGAEPRRSSRQSRSSSSRARRRSRRQNEAGSLQSQCDVASPPSARGPAARAARVVHAGRRAVPCSSRGLRPPDRRAPQRRKPSASRSAARFLLRLAQCH